MRSTQWVFQPAQRICDLAIRHQTKLFIIQDSWHQLTMNTWIVHLTFGRTLFNTMRTRPSLLIILNKGNTKNVWEIFQFTKTMKNPLLRMSSILILRAVHIIYPRLYPYSCIRLPCMYSNWYYNFNNARCLNPVPQNNFFPLTYNTYYTPYIRLFFNPLEYSWSTTLQTCYKKVEGLLHTYAYS